MKDEKLLEIFRQLHKGYSKGGYGVKKITTAGKPHRITDQFKDIALIRIKALSTNTGLVFIGFDEHLKGDGYELSAKEEVPIQIDDLSKVWIDVSTDGEGICYITLV